MAINSKKPRNIFFLALLATAGLAYWLSETEDTHREDQLIISSEPEQYMENFQVTLTDPSGQPYRWLSAEFMAHYSDHTDLRNPVLKLKENENSFWEVRSNTGRIQRENDLYLEGDVNMTHLTDIPEEQLTIIAEDLHVILDKRLGQTDNPVQIKNPNTTLNAVGMRIYLNQKRLQLLSKVHGKYINE